MSSVRENLVSCDVPRATTWRIHHLSESTAFQHGLDLILMPGVAFDRKGHRLGHGKGHYDKFIATYHDLFSQSSPFAKPVLIGLSLSEQLIENESAIPCEAHDVLLDLVVTPIETIDCLNG